MTTTMWTPLLPIAMVGTDRSAQGSRGWPAWPGEVGALLAEIGASTDPANLAQATLRAAGVLAACGLAGGQGLAWDTPLPAPAGEERGPALDDAPLLGLIGRAFSDGPPRLQHEVFTALAQAGQRLPPSLLPPALELGRRSLALRPALVPVLGERGRWLAAQRDDWRYAAGVADDAPADTRWTDGTIEQRRAFLADERAHDPAAARERLAAALPEVPAKERADLAATLATGLGPDDEPLLDALRSDRSREVRQVALGLLLRLPQAAHPQRAAERVRALLTEGPSIDAPTEFGSDWKADQLDATRPKHESLGERAWWLYQLVRQVPLGWWTTHTGQSAAALCQWARGTDWAEALLRGWYDVLLAAPVFDWCEAFLNDWPGKTVRDDSATVLSLLPLAQRERHWQGQLSRGETDLSSLAPRLLAACPLGEGLSRELSDTLAALVRQQAEQACRIDQSAGVLRQDYGLLQALPDLGSTLHPDALPALANLPRPADETPAYARSLHALTHVVALRRALHTLTAAAPSP